MKTEYINLKEASLNNNCPECYSTDGMILSFKQKRIKSRFWVKTKSEIVDSLHCTKCENEIFPGQWTLDIERVHSYHKKMISNAESTFSFTPLFYVVSILAFLVLAALYTFIFHQEFINSIINTSA